MKPSPGRLIPGPRIAPVRPSASLLQRIPAGGIIRSDERNLIETAVYIVPGMSCDHCAAAVIEEISALPGVAAVTVDLETKRVEVRAAAIDDAAIRVAIEEAGYEAA